MMRLLRLAAPAALCLGGAFAQNPAVDEPHRRPLPATRAGADPEPAGLLDNGFARLEEGWSWEARRYFREVSTRAPDLAIGHVGRALAARTVPRRAVEAAWAAYRAREGASPEARAVIDAYARYFGAESRPDRTDPRHDTAPPAERRAALLEVLTGSAATSSLAARLFAIEGGPSARSNPIAVLRERAAWLARERAMPFVVPDYATLLELALRRDGLDDGDRRTLERLPRHPHFPQTTVTYPGIPAATAIDVAAWEPPVAPGFDLPRGLGGRRTLDDRGERPVIVVFFLGFGCVHCIEQLNALAPQVDAFRAAGIDIVTIGTDTPDQVKASFQMAVENGDEPLPFDILCDPDGASFRAWRAWDEFDEEALHGTFLVDPEGRVLWQDVSVEPFMQTEFLLGECVRLLAAWR